MINAILKFAAYRLPYIVTQFKRMRNLRCKQKAIITNFFFSKIKQQNEKYPYIIGHSLLKVKQMLCKSATNVSHCVVNV